MDLCETRDAQTEMQLTSDTLNTPHGISNHALLSGTATNYDTIVLHRYSNQLAPRMHIGQVSTYSEGLEAPKFVQFHHMVS